MKFPEHYIFEVNLSFQIVLVRCRCGLIIGLGALDSQIEANQKKNNILFVGNQIFVFGEY